MARDTKGLAHLAILLPVSGEVRRVLSDESFHLRKDGDCQNGSGGRLLAAATLGARPLSGKIAMLLND